MAQARPHCAADADEGMFASALPGRGPLRPASRRSADMPYGTEPGLAPPRTGRTPRPRHHLVDLTISGGHLVDICFWCAAQPAERVRLARYGPGENLAR